jgi:hypothetical protein
MDYGKNKQFYIAMPLIDFCIVFSNPLGVALCRKTLLQLLKRIKFTSFFERVKTLVFLLIEWKVILSY